MLSPDFIDEVKSQAYMGVPSRLGNVCEVYPLNIKDIIKMGYSEYSRRLGTLLLTEVEIQRIIKEKTKQEIPLEEIEPLTYLLQSADQNDIFFLELSMMFSTFLQEDVLLLPQINAVQVGPIEEKRLITKENFRDLQDILRLQNRKEVKAAPPKNETYGERKMRLLRERVAEAKRRQAEKESQAKGLSFADQLEIATVFGIDINSCTLYAFYGLIRRHQAREKWNNDIRMLCAGADSKKIDSKYWGESSLDD